jgi:hypothetical protein
LPSGNQEVLYAKLNKLGLDINRLKKMEPTEMHLEGLLDGLLRLRRRKVIRFVSTLIQSSTGL